jgi:hypothetical protein
MMPLTVMMTGGKSIFITSQPPVVNTNQAVTDRGTNSLKVKVPGVTVTAVHPSLLPWKVLGFAGVLKVNVKSESGNVAPGASLITVLQIFNVAVSAVGGWVGVAVGSPTVAGCSFSGR